MLVDPAWLKSEGGLNGQKDSSKINEQGLFGPCYKYWILCLEGTGVDWGKGVIFECTILKKKF